MRKSALFVGLITIVLIGVSATFKKYQDPKPKYVEIITRFGVMKVLLYDDTPLHRDNFLKWVRAGFYDSLTFHMVTPEGTAQGGDIKSKYATEDSVIGDSDFGYRIPAEFRPNRFHKYGAISAARDINPEFASHPTQFFLVRGTNYNVKDLQKMEGYKNQMIRTNIFYTLMNADSTQKRIADFGMRGDKEGLRAYTKTFQSITDSIFAKRTPFTFTTEQIRTYNTIGGIPQLDSGYTVFGEVVSGLHIIDSICNQPAGKNKRPLKDIRMKIREVKN
jgi:cyclophilin family peptidyl-prolyl cis-trans isomerase